LRPPRKGPDQSARSLRDAAPLIPAADCSALDLSECNAQAPKPVRDIWVRWLQLDDDRELEAVLVMEAEAEWTHMAYVFDRQGKWNLVGSFSCYRHYCDPHNLVRVQRLTLDSPPLVLVYRDEGGSGTVTLVTHGFQLRGGKLWPAIDIYNYEQTPFVKPYKQREAVFAHENRLVVQTLREQPPGAREQSSCRVLGWDTAKHAFVEIPEDRARYCDAQTGKPIAEKSHWTGLPFHP
jgi:hypothetical protein